MQEISRENINCMDFGGGGGGGRGGGLMLLEGGLLKRFGLFLYLNHSFILSLNVRICIRFIVFLQISFVFYLSILELGGEVTNLGGSIFAWGKGWGSVPITCHVQELFKLYRLTFSGCFALLWDTIFVFFCVSHLVRPVSIIQSRYHFLSHFASTLSQILLV